MSISISFDSIPKTLSKFMFKQFKNKYDEDSVFIIKLNDVEIRIPLEFAVSISNKIADLLEEDELIRTIDVNLRFINSKSKKIISDVFQHFPDGQIQIDEEFEDIIHDLALFGKKIGCEAFVLPFVNYYSKNNFEKINQENVLSLFEISTCEEASLIFNQQINFIASHFDVLAEDKKFIESCSKESNESMVDALLSNENLKIKHESQLFQFVLKLSKNRSDLDYLFKYVKLDYCEKEDSDLFVEYLTTKEEFQSYRMNSILQCIQSRLCIHEFPENKVPPKRFDKALVISSNTGERIDPKYIKKIGYTYEFSYPSSNSYSCKSVFKVTLPIGLYKLECYGASGGKSERSSGGCGGYSSGILNLMEETDLYLYIGGQGGSSQYQKPKNTGGFNGGGKATAGQSYHLLCGGGGGATDIRINSEELDNRIMVAGGGGGSVGTNEKQDFYGGNGGGNNGGDGFTTIDSYYGTGGTQERVGETRGKVNPNPAESNKGGNAICASKQKYGSGGGGGG